MSNKFVCCTRTFYILLVTFINFDIQAQVVKELPNKASYQQSTKNFIQGKLCFTENLGQLVDMEGKPMPNVLYSVQGGGMLLFITTTGLAYQFMHASNFHDKQPKNAPDNIGSLKADYDMHRFNMVLKNALKPSAIIKEQAGIDLENFYLPHCPQGIINVKNYQRITLQDIYPNIDWVMYIKNNQVEYDFIVKPGGRVEDIQMQYEGIDDISIITSGALEIKTSIGILQQKAPTSFQSKTKSVKSSFTLHNNTVSFTCSYDPAQTLTIDPVIEWSTYYGGSGTEYIDPSTTVDLDGNSYLVGGTNSTSSISQLGFQNAIGGLLDAFIVKFDKLGNRLWATYFGGLKDDYALSVVTDVSKNVIICGETYSTNGISFSGFQNFFGGGITDGFVLKLNSLGKRSWSSYYGGTGNESITSCVADAAGNIFFAGETSSTNAASIAGGTGFRFKNNGKQDMFLVKFSSTGGRIWGTFYGGEDIDYSASCAVDAVGNVFLVGSTYSSTLIATSGSHQNIYSGNGDGVVIKFTSSCSRLWATYFGGTDYDRIYSSCIDKKGNILATGATASLNGIAKNAAQSNFGGGCCDALIVKMNNDGVVSWATYFGQEEQEKAEGITTDVDENVYVAGYSGSQNNISQEGFQNDYGGGFNDAILVKYLKTGEREWSSYKGGSESDFGLSISNDKDGNLYLSGITNSTDGIEYFGFRPQYAGGNYDAFLTKINDEVFPITILNFNVKVSPQQTALLSWQTASEINAKEFVIERSIDGRVFSNIATVSAKGSNATYTFADLHPAKGINYYRLKMVDKDASYTYSELRNISIRQLMAYLAPNPVIKNTNAVLYLSANDATNISITDVNGRVIWESVTKNESSIILPLSAYLTGIYFISLRSENAHQVIKLIKQ